MLVDNPWELFPSHAHLGTDEAGNEVLVDTSAGEDGPVFGLWHDPAAVVVLARSQRDFDRIAQGFDGEDNRALPSGVQSIVDAACRDSAAALIARDDAAARLGSSFAGWLQALPEGALIADLRDSRPGSGFTWDLDTRFTRHPAAAVFALASQPRPKGLLRRLFG